MATQGVAQSVPQTFVRAKRNDTCWRLNSKLWGSTHTAGPYVAKKERSGERWEVWSSAGTAAMLATEDEALAAMHQLAAEWEEFTARKVYFIGTANKVGELVKIGVAYEPRKRLSAIQTASPVSLQILGTMRGDERLEGKLHSRYRNAQVQGEWFRITPALKRLIDETAGDAQ